MAENSATVEAKDKDPEQATLKSSRSRKQSVSPLLNMAEIRELAELVNEHGFTDFEFENENIRVRLSKAAAYIPVAQPVQTQAAFPQPQAAAAAQAEAAPKPADTDEGLHKITSPIVGTFYRSPGPDKEAYVTEGSKVTPESVVCIVEAMKLMNEIHAEIAGEVVKIYVENGQPVEFGQPLFGIKQ